MILLTENYFEIIEEKLNKYNMMNTVTLLACKDNARVSGCEGEWNTARFAKKHFEDYGLKTSIMEFNLNRPVSMGVGYLNIAGESFFVKSFNGGFPITNDLKGELINVGLGTKEEIEALGSLKGKIALIQRGYNTLLEKASNAYKAEAEAILIYNNGDGITTAALGEHVPMVPVLALSKANGKKLISMMEQNSIILTSNNFDIDIYYEKEGKSCNVIGTLLANEQNENTRTIIIGAHMDSVSCPGANDNASGVAVVMELARLFSSVNIKDKLKYNINFVTFGSEELGLLGSEAYVRELRKNNTIDSIQAVIAIDMIGVGDRIEILDFKDEISQVVKDIAIKNVESRHLKLGQVHTGMNSSDHAHFELVGIPSCLIETAPSGDYHTEADIIDRIDPMNLYNVARVITGMILDLEKMDNPILQNIEVEKIK